MENEVPWPEPPLIGELIMVRPRVQLGALFSAVQMSLTWVFLNNEVPILDITAAVQLEKPAQ